MEIYCTRPNCKTPINYLESFESLSKQSAPPQRFCSSCGMKLVLGGRYIPLQPIGSGAFGFTFLARDLNTIERRCIVKQLRPQTSFKSDQLVVVENLFRREAAVLEKLGDLSDQVPTLFDSFVLKVDDQVSGDSQELFYLVQQYIDGQDLALEMKNAGAFSQDKVLELLYQILPVLHIVHDSGAIHRDIKPANIMRSNRGLMYLIDFGAVKQFLAGPNNTDTPQSIVIGTEGFAPLEQMSGRGVYPSTDLYALAMSCICLMGNIKPTHEGFHDFVDNWQQQLTLTESLKEILARMLLTRPMDRYQSALEVLDALQAQNLTPSIPPTFPSGGSQSYGRSNFGASVGTVPQISVPFAPVTPMTVEPSAIPSSLPAGAEQFSEEAQPTIFSLRKSETLWPLIRRSLYSGAGGLFLATLLSTALGTIWFSPVWLLVAVGIIFFCYRNSFTTWQMLGATLLSNAIVFLVFSVNKISSLLATGVSGWLFLLVLLVLAAILAFMTMTIFDLMRDIFRKRSS
jgi:serine/threonine protein kinase